MIIRVIVINPVTEVTEYSPEISATVQKMVDQGVHFVEGNSIFYQQSTDAIIQYLIIYIGAYLNELEEVVIWYYVKENEKRVSMCI